MPADPHSFRVGGAGARNEAMNLRGVPMSHAEKLGKEMGVNPQTINSRNQVEIVGKVLGRDADGIYFDANEVSGGATDSRRIPFPTSSHNDRSFGNIFQKEPMRAIGEQRWDPSTKSNKMSYRLEPASWRDKENN